MAGTSNRGFASMDAAKQREIASKGGKAAHQKGTAHQFTSEEARRAGSKGGRAARQKRASQQAQQGVKTPHLVLRKDESDEINEISDSNLKSMPKYGDDEHGSGHDQASNA